MEVWATHISPSCQPRASAWPFLTQVLFKQSFSRHAGRKSLCQQNCMKLLYVPSCASLDPSLRLQMWKLCLENAPDTIHSSQSSRVPLSAPDPAGPPGAKKVKMWIKQSSQGSGCCPLSRARASESTRIWEQTEEVTPNLARYQGFHPGFFKEWLPGICIRIIPQGETREKN